MMLWANSADSHMMEPPDLWTAALPPRLAHRAPRAERDRRCETLYIDNVIQRRALNDYLDSFRPAGAYDIDARLADMDAEGVWAQLAFPSLGFWTVLIRDRELADACVRAYNDWCHAEVIRRTSRVVPAACLSMVSVDDAVRELERVAGLGFQAAFLPTVVAHENAYSLPRWERLWAVAAEAGVLLGFHIGTGAASVVDSGPGSTIINYVESTYPGMRVVTHLVASGALDRYPSLRILIAEGGGSWAPALADRMNEAYRQHGKWAEPKLSMLPGDFVYRQVYTSFQHDQSAVPVMTGTDYRNMMWGDDYPHLEGTFGHTQETLRTIFDGVREEVRHSITHGVFETLFSVPEIPGRPNERSG